MSLRTSLPLLFLLVVIATPAGCAQRQPVADAAIAATPVASAAPVATAQATPDHAAILALAKRIGVVCDDSSGSFACVGGRPEVGDYYDIDMHPGCGQAAVLGQVTSDHAELRDKIAPLDRETTGVLTKGQEVCIEAVGHVNARIAYYFVSAPAETATREECRSTRQGVHCKSGWLRSDDIRRIGISP